MVIFNNNYMLLSISPLIDTDMSNERVLVTGASGFIASHIVKLLLEKGFIVRGTVRSLKNQEKVNELINLQQHKS